MNTDIAKTILEQIGGQQALFMLNAHASLNERELQISHIKSRKNQHVTIKLEDNDTYTLSFFKWHKKTYTMECTQEYTGVYSNMLRMLIEKHTGLFLKL